MSTNNRINPNILAYMEISAKMELYSFFIHTAISKYYLYYFDIHKILSIDEKKYFCIWTYETVENSGINQIPNSRLTSVLINNQTYYNKYIEIKSIDYYILVLLFP